MGDRRAPDDCRGGAFTSVWERPWTVPMMLVSPPGKLRMMFIWLAPFAFLPLRSPYGLLLIPVALADRRRRGYEPAFEQDGWVVLRRSAGAPSSLKR